VRKHRPGHALKRTPARRKFEEPACLYVHRQAGRGVRRAGLEADDDLHLLCKWQSRALPFEAGAWKGPQGPESCRDNLCLDAALGKIPTIALGDGQYLFGAFLHLLALALDGISKVA